MTTYKVSKYQKVSAKAAEEVDLLAILSAIQKCIYSEEVDLCLKEKEDGGEEAFSEAKKRFLFVFTVCGLFGEKRRKEFLEFYNQLLILDIDDIPIEKLESIRQEIIAIPFTYCVFVSPSGLGLKVIVRISSGKEQHTNAFLQAASFYEEFVPIVVDQSGKDITRLCYVSSDANLFLNEDSIVFPVEESNTPVAKTNAEPKNGVEISLLSSTNETAVLTDVLDFLTANELSITSDYSGWVKTAFAIASCLSIPEEERIEWFLKFARLDENKHNEQKSRKLILDAIKTY